jgi:hypothetical protein
MTSRSNTHLARSFSSDDGDWKPGRPRVNFKAATGNEATESPRTRGWNEEFYGIISRGSKRAVWNATKQTAYSIYLYTLGQVHQAKHHIFVLIQCYMIVWIRYSRQVQARSVILILQIRRTNEVLLRQKADHKPKYTYSQLPSYHTKKKSLTVQYSEPWMVQMVKWWSEDYEPECSPGWLDARAFSRGWSAFTTILMFGRKSASYWTHNAATAANYLKGTRNK